MSQQATITGLKCKVSDLEYVIERLKLESKMRDDVLSSLVDQGSNNFDANNALKLIQLENKAITTKLDEEYGEESHD